MTERDPYGIDPHTPGAKLDADKPMVWLCIAGFSRALAAVSEVTTKGAIKYTPNGWMTVPNGDERYMEAFGRHMLALGRGELHDRETGCLHKAQMIWNLLASLEIELRDARLQLISPQDVDRLMADFQKKDMGLTPSNLLNGVLIHHAQKNRA